MVDPRRHLGTSGEEVAERFLARKGFVCLDRQWRCQLGEIDLVMRDRETLVIIEVKTRSGDIYGNPLEAITPKKLSRLQKLAELYCRQIFWHGPYRIDGVGLTKLLDGSYEIQHLVNLGE